MISANLKRAIGALVGVAFGDAFGMPVEMFTQKKIRQDYGYIRDFMPGAYDNPITKGFKKGEVTDDTLMSVICCEHLIKNHGDIVPLELVKEILAWADKVEKSKSVIGPSSRLAFDKILAGTPIEEAGKTGTTNGAAMKVTPMGILCNISNLDTMLDKVHKLCMPTHNTAPAVSGAMAVAGVVSAGIDGSMDINDIVNFAIACAKKGEERGYQVISPSVHKRIAFACKHIMGFDNEKKALAWCYNILGAGLPIAETVPAAFAMLLLGGADPKICAGLCASLGGDTDTIASITCAMAGAIRGIDAFMPDDIAMLNSVNDIDLEHLATAVYKLRG